MTAPRVALVAVVAATIVLLWALRRSRAALPGPVEHPEILQFDQFRMTLAKIEPGTFTMGSPETEDGHDAGELQHQVTLTKPYWMATTHVTRRHFNQFIQSTGYKTSAERVGRSIGYGENVSMLRYPSA